MWPLKGGSVYADEVARTAKAAPTPAPSYGEELPGYEQERPDATITGLDKLFDLHGACWGYSERLTKDEAVRAAVSATLLIAAQKAGLA